MSGGDNYRDGRPVVVLGGTGHLGRHIVRALLDREVPVRVLSRSASSATEVLGNAVEIIEGDVTRSADVDRTLNGARAVVISVAAFSPKLIRRIVEIEQTAVLNVLERAATLGVVRVVFISVYDINRELIEKLDLVPGRIKGCVEQALRESGLNWTVLGAPPAMDLYFKLLRGNKLMVPGGGPPALVTIASRDVGQIAAQAVLRDDLHGLRFKLAGPEALSFPEAARRLSKVLNRPVTVRKIPLFLPRLAAFFSRPFTPYVHMLVSMMRLMNAFPLDEAERAPDEHKRLLDTFDFVPTTLEDEARSHLMQISNLSS